MRALLTWAVGLLTISVSNAHEDAEALHLLQTSLAKVSAHSDKECNRAKKAARDLKKKLKEDRLLAKQARDAWKRVRQTLKETQQAEADAKAHATSICPVPEVDNSPDQGCSRTVVNSYVLHAGGQRHSRDLLREPLPQGYYGIEEVVPGGGVPEGLGTPMGTKLGISVMQPCSVAWTTGNVNFQSNAFNHVTGEYRISVDGRQTIYQLRRKIGNVASPCECREKADAVLKWPEAAAVEFLGNRNGGPGACSVWSMTNVSWEHGGFWLENNLITDHSGLAFTCYLGNPEEWKQRLAAERAIGATMDKCKNTDLWASGKMMYQDDPTKYVGAKVMPIHVGTLNLPGPLSGTPEGRKLCLKWTKADERCAGAVAIQLQYNNQCWCWFASRGLATTVRQLPNPTFEGSERNGLNWEMCML